LTSANKQNLHKRIKADITDNTQALSLGPSLVNCLVMNFVLPDNDGVADTLNAITLRLDSPTATAISSDFKEVRLWADNGDNLFGGGDADLGAGSLNGDSWEFYPFSQAIPINGKRFFVTVNTADNPSTDNATCIMEIPMLYDANSDGGFSSGDRGVFVAFCHKGPTDKDWTPGQIQTLHCRKTGSITDDTQVASFGPKSQDAPVFCFSLPDADGVQDTLQALTLKLNLQSSALHTDFDEVRLWLDAGAVGFQGVGIDTSLAVGNWDGDSFVFSGFSQAINGTKTFFVTVDVKADPSSDDAVILMEIPKLSDSDGSFNAGDEGIFVSSNHDGPTDSSLVAKGSQTLHKRAIADITESTLSQDFCPGEKNGLVLNFVLPDNDGGTDTLQGLTTRLDALATAISSDFSAVRLWADNGDNAFEVGTDTNIGTASYDGNSWVFSGLAQTITTSQRFFVAVDIIANPSADDATIIMEIPTLSDAGEIGTWNTNDEGI
ncbi:MAG: hypothetical protein AAB296_01430, partial [Candidatus Desantisbacteria bacterium]